MGTNTGTGTGTTMIWGELGISSVWHSLFWVCGLHEVALVCVMGLHNKALFFKSRGGWEGGSFRASVCVLASPMIFAVTVGTAPDIN